MDQPEETQIKQISEMYEAVPQDMPEPTIWPIALALGVVFFFWGFVTSLIISAVGLIVTGFSIAGWIGEFHNE